jgi:hypothetical protein
MPTRWPAGWRGLSASPTARGRSPPRRDHGPPRKGRARPARKPDPGGASPERLLLAGRRGPRPQSSPTILTHTFAVPEWFSKVRGREKARGTANGRPTKYCDEAVLRRRRSGRGPGQKSRPSPCARSPTAAGRDQPSGEHGEDKDGDDRRGEGLAPVQANRNDAVPLSVRPEPPGARDPGSGTVSDRAGGSFVVCHGPSRRRELRGEGVLGCRGRAKR